MRDPRPQGQGDNLDDVDRLFARLEPAPVPDELTARVLTSTVARTNTTRAVLAWPWFVAGLAAVGLLSIAGYELGASLATNDGLDVVAGIFDDLGLVATSPGDVLAALGEVIPWSLVVLASVSAAMLILATGQVVSRAPRLGTRWPAQ
jgi:hypothetical protein